MHSFFIMLIFQGLPEVVWCREGRIHRLLVPVLLLLQPLRVAGAPSVSNASAPDLFGDDILDRHFSLEDVCDMSRQVQEATETEASVLAT